MSTSGSRRLAPDPQEDLSNMRFLQVQFEFTGINDDSFDAEKVMFALRFVLLSRAERLDVKRSDMAMIDVTSLSQFSTRLQLQIRISSGDVEAFEVSMSTLLDSNKQQ